MTLKQLVESKAALENLLKGSLPIGIAWELKKFAKAVNPELTSYDEIRNQKIQELGEEFEEEGKKMIRVKPQFMPDFAKAISELLAKELDIKIPQVKIGELLEYKDVNGKSLSITTSDLMLLEWLIVE